MTRRPAARHLVTVGVLAVIGAAAGDALLAVILRAATGTGPEFPPLQLAPVVAAGGGATTIGYLVLAAVVLLGRRRPLVIAYVAAVWVLAVVSLAVPVLLLTAPPEQMLPGTTAAAALALIPLHLLPAVALTLAARRLV